VFDSEKSLGEDEESLLESGLFRRDTDSSCGSKYTADIFEDALESINTEK